MTRLSCHRFRSNEVRLWLTIIAYNLGTFGDGWCCRKGSGNWSLTSLQQRAGENRRTAGETCALLLAIVGREPSDATAVRSDGAADGGSHDPAG